MRVRETRNSLKSSISDQRKFSQHRLGRDCQRLCSSSLLISHCEGSWLNCSGCCMAWRQQSGQNLLDSPPTAGQCWEDDEAAWRQQSLSCSWAAGCVQCWIFCHRFLRDSAYTLAIYSAGGFSGNKLPDIFHKYWTESRLWRTIMGRTQHAVHTQCRSLCSLRHFFPSVMFWSVFFMFCHYLSIFIRENRYPMINMCGKLSPRTIPWLAWDYLVNWLEMGRLPSPLSNPPLAPIQQST